MTTKQANLVYYNLPHILELKNEERDLIQEMCEDPRLHEQDANELVGYVWDLANKRGHEWVAPIDRYKTLFNIQDLVKRYKESRNLIQTNKTKKV